MSEEELPMQSVVPTSNADSTVTQSWKCLTLPTVLSSPRASSSFYDDSHLDQTLRDLKTEYSRFDAVDYPNSVSVVVAGGGSFFDTPEYVKQELLSDDCCDDKISMCSSSYDGRALASTMIDDGVADLKSAFFSNPHHHPLSFENVRTPFYVSSPSGYETYKFRPTSCILPATVAATPEDLVRNGLYPLKYQIQHCLASMSGADINSPFKC